jgi:hypothetical protein
VVSTRGRWRQAREQGPRALWRDERGQSLPVVLTLITFLFIVGSAMAAHASVALRTTVANETQGGDMHAADAGVELGIWWQRNGRSGNPPDITVNGRTVSTTVTNTGGVACASPNPVVITGFESGAVSTLGDGSFAAITGSGVTSDGSIARSGTRSLRIANPAGSLNSALLASSGSSGVARVYLRLASLPVADVAELLAIDTVSGSDLQVGYQAATQRLTLALGGPPVPATATISAATWVRLDLRLRAGTDPRSASWEVDGASQPPVSSAELVSTVTGLRLGSTVAADAFTVNVDDVIVSATPADFPIGAGAVLPLRPDGMGTSATPGSFHREDGSAIGANSYQALTDNPMTSLTDYIRQDAVGGSSYVELTLSDTTASCIVGVSGLLAYHAAGPGTNNGTTTIVDGATERILYSGDMSERVLFYRTAIITPATAWTTASVNNLRARIGYSTDVSPFNPYWDALLLQVATGQSRPGSVTVSATAGASTVTATYPDVGAGTPVLDAWSTSR